jgi:ABC-2 type transport system ATP-binding protein
LTLQVTAMCKSFGQRKVLDDISLHVAAGEFVALLGPNGAGKTTLFQILSGLFIADQGNAVICGADMGKTPIPALAQLGIVFQQPALDLDLSVTANLQFQADLHGIPRLEAKQRIASCLARFGLSERARDAMRVLSGGNRRRVELARALMTQPKLLLMDEATVGIDPASRLQIIADVKALCKERNMAVLWATHLVEEADDANRIIVMAKGRVQFDGLPVQLLARQKCTTLTDAFLRLTE